MSNLVFITGGSGHIGSRIIIDTLEAGYSVRAAVRSQAKAEKILSISSIKALNPGNKLEFTIVPDLLADGAYDEAIKGAQYIIHVASPITDAHKEGDSYQATLIEPAIKGTLNILEAAKKTGSVKRIVITSSVVAIIPWSAVTSPDPSHVYNEKSRTEFVSEPYDNTFQAYSASKVAALNETEAWLEKEKSNISFDVVNIFPSFVIGKDELVTEASDAIRGTNAVVLGVATGEDRSYTPGISVDNRDVSIAHVKSLDSKVPGNQGYVLSYSETGGTKWEEIHDIVATKFPDAVASGKLSNDGKIVTVPVTFDASASEKVLGFKYRDYKVQIEDVVAWYLGLPEAKQ